MVRSVLNRNGGCSVDFTVITIVWRMNRGAVTGCSGRGTIRTVMQNGFFTVFFHRPWLIRNYKSPRISVFSGEDLTRKSLLSRLWHWGIRRSPLPIGTHLPVL